MASMAIKSEDARQAMSSTHDGEEPEDPAFTGNPGLSSTRFSMGSSKRSHHSDHWHMLVQVLVGKWSSHRSCDQMVMRQKYGRSTTGSWRNMGLEFVRI